MVLLAAGLLDELVGDPEGWPHPVRVLGWIIQRLDRARRTVTSRVVLRVMSSRAAVRGLGLLLALGLCLLSGGTAWLAHRAAGPWGWVVDIVLGAWMLSGRSLRVAVARVAEALEAGDLGCARQAVGRVVGRDTQDLDEGGVVRAGLETLGESLCDGVVAPLFWFAMGGLPGLWAFKAASTLDSMVGHREAPWTDFGWASARLDDLLNLVPARFTALFIALVFLRVEPLRAAWREARRHASPNAGWGEAALAAALNVQLGGLNHYDGVPHQGPTFGRVEKPLEEARLREGLALGLRVNLAALLSMALLGRLLHG
ncbi:cobalamin biosynthesis protein CobD [Geothrix limicola]|uniref:Cobalamin biosynthesis protein CobD n=1 Tax=Geothrix limicola TaxID=2927978 RepID=A0ABQ5QFX8_9BACT|nr:adenosylcobinamide-phosphate synthase CbiB [Geothrix limicola]GLH73473.1 cobalamin biosynthesis protein CobD [Geothrix limicola]